MSTTPPSVNTNKAGVQFGRQASVIVAATQGPTPQFGTALNFSSLDNFHFTFETEANDVESPNIARIRLYNLSPQTVKQVISEFDTVIINAGYETNLGTIFKGTIKQFRRGKESNVDSFLDIFAADGDLPYNYGIVNVSLKEGTTVAQRFNAAFQGLIAKDGNLTLDPQATQIIENLGGILPRGKVMFGLSRDYLRDLCTTYSLRWSIQNGVITLVPLDSYLTTDQPIAVNCATGMIGVPEATEQGITLQTLLNPAFRVGESLKINNKDITETQIKEQFFPGYTDQNFPASIAEAIDDSNDGLYRIIVIEHAGDTRNQAWYSNLICLAINQSPGSNPAVAPYCIPLGS